MRTSYMDWVRYKLRDAYCVKLSTGDGYLVWPRKEVGPRGSEMAAIGYGKTANEAWKDAYKHLQ